MKANVSLEIDLDVLRESMKLYYPSRLKEIVSMSETELVEFFFKNRLVQHGCKQIERKTDWYYNSEVGDQVTKSFGEFVFNIILPEGNTLNKYVPELIVWNEDCDYWHFEPFDTLEEAIDFVECNHNEMCEGKIKHECN